MAKHSVKCLVNVCDRKLLFDLLYVRYARLAFTSVVRTDLFFSMKGVQGIKETVQTTSLYNVRNKSKKKCPKEKGPKSFEVKASHFFEFYLSSISQKSYDTVELPQETFPF